MTDNIINFEQQNNPVYTYSIAYSDPSGEVFTETFEGDAVMTNTFFGVVDSNQTLLFAVPMENVVSMRLVDGQQ